jgi:hypothetical protein
MKKAITTSTTILPIALVVGSVLWILPEAGNLLLWGGWFVGILTTYIWMETNARQQLIRERSRMVSTTFFLAIVSVPLLHEFSLASLLPLALQFSYVCLLAAYQERRPEGKMFHAFLLLGLSALLLPQVLWLVPLLLFSCGLHLRSLTLSSLWATLMALLLPLVGYSLWALAKWDFSPLVTFLEHTHQALTTLNWEYWQSIYTATPATLPTSDWQFLASAGGTLLLSLIAIVNQVRTSFLDKIRVRMFYYLMALVQGGLTVLLILYPEERWSWLLLLITNGAPLIAHYFTLTRGWLCTTVFWITFLTLILLTFFNYQTEWILSLIFS